jgi:murein DD-endopeptidase MepM/ murein hydrolase activator NlpD
MLGIPAVALSLLAVAAMIALPALSLVGARPTATPAKTAVSTPLDTPTPAPTFPPLVHNPTGATPGPTPLPYYKLTGYVWPLVGGEKPALVTLPFGPYKWGELIVNGKLFHDGVDMATDCGDNVYAAHDGVVLTAGRDYVDYMGWQGDLTAYKRRFTPPSWKETLPIVIVIDDGNGYRSIYAHESKVTVKAGDHVQARQRIGIEGASGALVTGCHLHYGLFAPADREVWENLPQYVESMKLPPLITKRIDPLLVLPYRNDVEEMHSLRPSDAAAWASAHPKG